MEETPGRPPPGPLSPHLSHTCVRAVWIHQTETSLALYNDHLGGPGGPDLTPLFSKFAQVHLCALKLV